MVSFDCFLSDIKLTVFDHSNYILKSFVSCFIPFIVFAIYVFVFIIWKLIWWKKTNFIRNIVVIFITVAFFLQPTLTQKSFSLLNCVSIYEDTWLEYDLEVHCWKGTHIYWAVGFAVPMLLLCFSFPIIGTIWMIINWKRLHDEKFKSYFIFFY